MEQIQIHLHFNMNIKNIDKKWIDGFASETESLSDAHFIRREVFMNEQKVSEDEEMIEEEDKSSYHLIFYINNFPIATGRILNKNNFHYLGRIAVLKEYRGKKIGSELTNELIKKSRELKINKLYIHSQTYAIKFYQKFGFKEYGDEFLDAGIKHYNMKLEL